MTTRSRAVDIFDEFGNAERPNPRPGRQSSAPQPMGSPAAQQWLTALARWCEGAEGAKVKQQLSGMLRCGARSRDKLAAVTNRARQQIGAVFSWSTTGDDAGHGADGPQRARQSMYLFERALHGVLLAALAQEEAAVAAGQAGAGGSAAAGEAAEGGTPALSSAARDRVVEAVLADAEHQLGLVHTCVEVVNYAYMGRASQAFPWATLQLGRLHHCLELWQGIDWVVDHLATPPLGAEGAVPGMPEDVMEYLAAVQVRVEEELAWIDGSSIYRRLRATGTSLGADAGMDTEEVAETDASDGESPQRPRPWRRAANRSPHVLGADAALVSRFLSNLGRTAMMRTSRVAQDLLKEHPTLEAACPQLPARACAVLDAAMGDRLDLLFGQHLSVVIACATFYTIKLHGGALPFRKLTALMSAVLLNHDDSTFGRVELPPADGAGWDPSEREYGDARAFYNRTFLPALSEYDAPQLFGKDAVAPTPGGSQLESAEEAEEAAAEAEEAESALVGAAESKRADVARLVAATAAKAGGGGLPRQGEAPAAGIGASGGVKDQKRLRRPLGQLSNSNAGKGSGAGRVAALHPR